MDNKKLIAGFGYQEGRISSWDGKRTYTQAVPQMAKHCCDNGVDEILVYDWSVTDEDHEAAIAVIKEVCREADAPVIAGGRVKRMEDVKKYLYAGASAVFLDMSKEENTDMIKEASDRFGKEKIYAYLPTDEYIDSVKDYEAAGASVMLLNTAGSVPSLLEMASISDSEASFLFFLQAKDDAKDTAESLKNAFGCGNICGAVLTFTEDNMDSSMTIKQSLKAAGISVDTFESSVDWKDFKLNSDGLIPVIVQDYKSNEVLMLAYMNEEAFDNTLATGRMTYFSRSRQAQWVKGETSGHFQYVKSLKIDCDNDTLLATVKQIGAACHTGNRSCFYTTLAEPSILQHVQYSAMNRLES